MHTKRISAGLGKTHKWAVACKASSKQSTPLLTVIRDKLGLADNAREAKTILNNSQVMVDGSIVKDHQYGVGLMSVITIPLIKKSYRALPSNKGLIFKEIPGKEAGIKPCRINGKQIVTGGKTQLSLHDGSTILTDDKCKVNDTLILEIPGRKIKKTIPLTVGTQVLVDQGCHSGVTGSLDEITAGKLGQKSISKIGDVQTLTEYVFAVGEKKPVITL